MKNALIGYTGFVGSTLLKQTHFDALYRSTNIAEIRNQSFNQVICAGAPAQKWLANKNPSEDLLKINTLIDHLKTIHCEQFILISTVDVFSNPTQVNEDSQVSESNLQAYGLHRRYLEKFVEEQFPNHLIIRLPGLVGPNLKKNIIFDFLNDNNTSLIESRNIFQFYPMINLWFDIQTALKSNIKLLHLTAEPLSVKEVAAMGFGYPFDNILNNKIITYDFQTKYAPLFGKKTNYQYSKKETIQAIRAYAQSEPLTLLKEEKL